MEGFMNIAQAIAELKQALSHMYFRERADMTTFDIAGWQEVRSAFEKLEAASKPNTEPAHGIRAGLPA
jgi:hypothetical protein